MQKENVRSTDALGFSELEIEPHSPEPLLPTILPQR